VEGGATVKVYVLMLNFWEGNEVRGIFQSIDSAETYVLTQKEHPIIGDTQWFFDAETGDRSMKADSQLGHYFTTEIHEVQP
jgi:hypothetical protein